MYTISLVLLSFLSNLTFLIAQSPNFQVLRYAYCFHNKGNYTNTSTYQTNLNTLLSNLTYNTNIDYGFYNSSYGQKPNRVSAIGLCRGDVKPTECRNCLNNAAILIQNKCPNHKEVIGGSDECMLRYSNRSILGVIEDEFSLYIWNRKNAKEVEKYDDVLRKLLERLRDKAANGDSLRKFAVGNETGPNFQTVYGAVQCVPDLSGQNCTDCLVKAISEIPDCCGTKIGARIIKPSCNIRFESARFYDYVEDSAPQASPPLSPPMPTSKGKNNTSRTVIIISVSIVALAFIGLKW